MIILISLSNVLLVVRVIGLVTRVLDTLLVFEDFLYLYMYFVSMHNQDTTMDDISYILKRRNKMRIILLKLPYIKSLT